MSLYITDLTDDEPLPDYSLLKETFIAAEAKAASNTITKTSEGLKVDIFKENIGIFSFSWHFSSAMFNKSAIEFMMLSLKHHHAFTSNAFQRNWKRSHFTKNKIYRSFTRFREYTSNCFKSTFVVFVSNFFNDSIVI